MANEEHIRILLQGAKVWNQWREDALGVETDFRRVKLFGDALKAADLRGAELNGADLKEVNLRAANLFGAKLEGANLTGADLRETDLRGADLTRADLTRADLTVADLTVAKLTDTNLSGANLTEVDLSKAELDLSNLQSANLQTARLINANLDGANLTDAKLWETQRAGWSIKGVICESVYWDKEGKEKTFYLQGNFERLFAEQKKIKLFYKDGANLLEIATLPSIIKNLEEKHPGCKLSFQSIEETSGGAIATLVLEESKDLDIDEVEAVRALIQAEAERNIEAFRQALNSKDQDITLLQGEVRALDRTINNMMGKLQPVTYINQGQVQAMGDGAQAHDSSLYQIVNAENSEVKTQVQGERNVVSGESICDSNIITGDKNSIK